MTVEALDSIASSRNLNDAYSLPVDKVEADRLNRQHEMWKRFLGGKSGLYPVDADGLIQEIMNRQNSSAPFVMDLGSGSGIWAVEMAEQFPNASVLGIDLTESKPNSIPPNCRFITKDFLKGMEEYTGKFDVIQARLVIGHVTDGVGFIRMLCDCLKPGGLLFLGDGDRGFYDENEKKVGPASLDPGADNTNKSWMTLLMDDFVKAMDKRVGPKKEKKKKDEVMATEPRFEVLGKKTFYDLQNCPEGSTDATKSNGWAFAMSVEPALSAAGVVPPEDVENIIHNISLEVNGPTKIFSRWHVTWAAKKKD